jgi:ABC-type Mn2+/Zn2+ transport system ATPase subunit
MLFFPYGQRRHAEGQPGAPALQVSAVRFGYPGSSSPVLHDIHLTVPAGTRTALVGANGSGKSTLLKAVAGLLRPQAGTIRIAGLPVGACHHRVSYLPQRGDIDWRFPVTLERMVLAGCYVHLGWLRRPGRAESAQVAAVLEQLGLSDLIGRQISQLSGGQQQRALLSRALVQEADLLLLDEPLSAVDNASREVIAGVLDGLRRQGKTALVATHHLDRLAEEFDTVLAIADGVIQSQPAPLEVYQ